MILNYICTWNKLREKTWSGTTFALYQALKDHFDVEDFGLDFTFLEKKIMKYWGKTTQTYQFNRMRDFIIQNKARRMLRNNTNVLLQIGDIIIPGQPSYIYQDLTVSFLKHLHQNDPEAFSYCGYSHVSNRAFDRKISRLNQVYRNSNGIFTMSQWLADYIVKSMGFSADKVHPVGAGINIDPEKIDTSQKVGNKILFIGRDFKRKAGYLVIDAFKVLVSDYQPNAELYIIGPIVNPVEGNHPNIHFIGEVSSAQLPYYFNLCDVFCMPSHFDAYGLVFIEALVYGLPCIGRNKFAMSEFIQDGVNGYLIDSDNIDTLALKMFELLKSDQIKRNIDMNREQYIEKYSWKAVSDRISRIIKADHH